MNDVKNFDNSNLSEQLIHMRETERTREEIVRKVFDDLRNKEEHFLAISVNMGESPSYMSSVSLDWFANRVKFASELEIFRRYSNDEGKSVAINEETLDYLSQRKPNWKRQSDMVKYLATEKYHKFPPVLLVAYQDWIFDKENKSDKWGINKRAREDSVTVKPLDSKGWIVDFDHSETKFYALDGQHRLMAVWGLQDLLKGKIVKKNKDGKASKRFLNFEEILQTAREKDPNSNLESIRSRLLYMMSEKIGVEIIPAVRAGETLEEAFKRLRQIFVDVNKEAKQLRGGEVNLLDEKRGFSIVARKVMVSHPLFHRDGKLIVDEKNPTLNKGDKKNYTTFQAIVTIAELYLGQLDIFHNEDSLCYTDEELENGKERLSAYFDAMKLLPSHERMAKGTEISMLRRRNEGNGGDDNALFRPITQMALAQAVGYLESNRNGLALEAILARLGEMDDPEESNLRLTDTACPFFGILCSLNGQSMRTGIKDRNLASEMFRYLLGGLKDDEREKLKEEIFECRHIISNGSEEQKAINCCGDYVAYRDFDLPDPWY